MQESTGDILVWTSGKCEEEKEKNWQNNLFKSDKCTGSYIL